MAGRDGRTIPFDGRPAARCRTRDRRSLPARPGQDGDGGPALAGPDQRGPGRGRGDAGQRGAARVLRSTWCDSSWPFLLSLRRASDVSHKLRHSALSSPAGQGPAGRLTQGLRRYGGNACVNSPPRRAFARTPRSPPVAVDQLLTSAISLTLARDC